MKKTPLAIAIVLIIAFAVTACGASAPEPTPQTSEAPKITLALFDGSYGTSLTLDEVGAITRAIAEDTTTTPGSVLSFWVLGKTLVDTRQIYYVEYLETSSRQKQKILAYKRRFIEVAVTSTTGVMEGVLVSRPHTTPLAEGISKLLRSRPKGAKALLIIATDMLAFGDGLNLESGPIPTDAVFAKWCATRGLLMPGSATDVSIVFVGVDLTPSDERATATSLARQARIEQLWTTALKNAGATDVTVIAGRLDFKRITRPRRRRKGSLLGRIRARMKRGTGERALRVTRIEHLPEPNLGVSLHHFIVSIIGPRPVHAPDTNPRHQRAVRDAMIGPEVDAQKRVVDDLALRRTQWSPNWTYLGLIILGAAAELIMSEQLYYHLGIDRPLSVVLAIGQTILLVALLTILTRTTYKSIAWGVCIVLLLSLGALAILRANEMAADEDTSALESAAKTVILVLATAGPAFFIEWILGFYTQAATVDRELRAEEDKLSELEGRMEAGRAFDEESYEAVVTYDALYRQVGSKALSEYPNHFKDESVPPPTLGTATDVEEETYDAN